jgi:hypothetical protein
MRSLHYKDKKVIFFFLLGIFVLSSSVNSFSTSISSQSSISPVCGQDNVHPWLNATLLGSISHYSSAYILDCEIMGDYFLSNAKNLGFFIIDIDDPENPFEVAQHQEISDNWINVGLI